MEHTAAFNNTDTKGYLKSTGWSGLTTSSASDKYATKYTNSSSDNYYPTSTSVILGDGIYDVNLNLGSSDRAWFNDYSYCALSGGPFFKRGGHFSRGSYAGVFGANNSDGGTFYGYSFRVVVSSSGT